MAIDIKSIFSDTLLSMCKKKPLSAITIKALLSETGASRQAFYNRFCDKNELIEWIYVNRVLISFQDVNIGKSYYDATLDYYQRIAEYHNFMKQACMIEGQNCLADFMRHYAIDYDLKWLKLHYGVEELPEALVFASTYHSMATINMAISWILTDMPSPPETMANYMTLMRQEGLGNLAFHGEFDFFKPHEPKA